MSAAEETPTETTLEGRRLGRYLLRYRIASGGMASVYLAQLAGASGFEKWVAIKVVHPHLTRDRRFATMFLDEARVCSRIQHPNVCSVLDFGEAGGTTYLVMEYLHGESLSGLVRRAWSEGRKCSPWLAARIVADAARGLHAAHVLKDEHGDPYRIVHRDVSPQNILVLYDGLSKVVDFGVAHARGRITESRTGEIKGKLAYMAPEQLRGGRLGPHTDVWALGVTLWEATVGRRLFRADNEGETVVKVLEQPIDLPTSLVPDYPGQLEQALMGALERPVDARTPSAAEFADALELYLYSTGYPSGPAQVSDWMRVHFADKRVQRDSLLRADALPIETVPEIMLESQSSMGSHLRSTTPHRDDVEAPDTERPPPPTTIGAPRANRTTVVALVLLSVVVLALAATLLVVLARPSEPVVTFPAAVTLPGGPIARHDEAPGPATMSTGAAASRQPEAVAIDASRAADTAGAHGLPGPVISRGVDRPPAPPVNSRGVDSPPAPPGPEPSGEPRGSAPPGPRPAAGREARTGPVNIVTFPAGARVYFRGQPIRVPGCRGGVTPCMGLQLPAGMQTLMLRLGADERTVRVHVDPRRTTPVSVRF